MGTVVTRRIKIALITPFFPNSAQPFRGNSTYQLARRLGKLADVSIFCALPRYPQWLQPRNFDHRPIDLGYTLPEVSVKYVEFPAMPIVSRPFNGTVCARCLLPYISHLSPDVILNLWLYPQGYAAVQIGKRLRIPTIVGTIGSDLNALAGLATRHLTRLTLQHADAVLAKSRQLRELAIQLGAKPAKVHTILNGCDTTIFRPSDRLAARKELSICATAQLIVYVGRLELTKGLRELLEAFAILRNRNPSVQLALVGDGPAQAMLIERARSLGMIEQIRFVPPQTSSGVALWLAACNLLALPSYAEGCPNVILEATTCGRPAVATNVGGIPEIVDDHCAVLIPPREIGELAKALEKALSRHWDEALIASKFQRSWDDMAREVSELCSSMLLDRDVCSSSQTSG